MTFTKASIRPAVKQNSLLGKSKAAWRPKIALSNADEVS
jgi:hypothetical protein